MPYRAVLFDVGETLWHAPAPPPPSEFRRLAAERVSPVLLAAGIEPTSIEHVARIAWDAIDPAIREARHGDLREPDYVEVVAAAVTEAGYPLPRDTVEALLDRIYISGGEAGKVPYDDARDVLLALKHRGFLLSSATNRAFGGQRFRCDLAECGLDIGWDAHSVSVEVGYLKPHPAVFEHALAELGVTAGEALMVGNSLAEDIAGAQQLGIATAWKRSRPDAEGIEPDFVFDDLSELLGCPGLEAADG